MSRRHSFPMLRWAVAGIAAIAFGCTTVDPVTGEEKIDPLPTAAAVAGAAAVGALIYTAADDDDDDDDHRHRRGYKGRGYRPFSPSSGVWCYPDQQRCYNNDGYAKKWTRRVFGD